MAGWPRAARSIASSYRHRISPVRRTIKCIKSFSPRVLWGGSHDLGHVSAGRVHPTAAATPGSPLRLLVVTDDATARPVDQHAVESGLDAGQLRRHVLPQGVAVAQRLRLVALDDLLRLID